MSRHIKPEHGLALVTLAPDDPERKQAYAHAQSCQRCRELLDEGLAMLALLDGLPRAVTASPELKQRVRAAVLTAPTKAPRTSRWQPWALGVGALVSLVFALFAGQTEGLFARVGVHCVLYEQLAAVVPFAIAATLGVRRVIALEPSSMAVASTAGALVGQALLHARCPAAHVTGHLLLFHVLGVVLAAALGYAGTRLLARGLGRS